MAEIFGTPNSGKSTPMAFPSPCGSGSGRRLSIGTPKSIAKKNDAEEIRERRKSKLFELQNKHLSSPLTPSKGSPRNLSSNPLRGLSTTQLSDHYANCVKLNAENKINIKNAFGLHLIDYMTDLLKGKKLGDFQVAGTTLDASAKIYASRVDAIHSETYKVLGTLSRGNKKKNKEDNTEMNDDDGSGVENENDEDMPANKVKKTKKIHRNKFIEKNLKNINLDTFELEYEMDPLFKSLTTAFAEGLSSGLLLSALSCYTDSSELVLDSTTIIDDIESQPVSKTNKDPVGMSDIKDFLEKENFYKSEICPSFSNFKFNNWNEADETMQAKDKVNSNYAFDMEAEAEDIPNDDMEDYGCEDANFDDGGADEDEEIVGLVGNNADIPEKVNIASMSDGDQLLKTTLSSISNARSMVDFLASAPSEYSFFNKKLLQTWKGPSHWKIHPMARNTASCKPSQSKTSVKKVKFQLDFEQEKDFQSDFKKARNCVLTKKRLEVMEATSLLLPKMLNYQPQALFGCFWKPSIMVRRQATLATTDDDLVIGYDYDNDNDKQNFCPDFNQDYDDNDDNSEDLFGFSCATSNASQQSDIISMSGETEDPTKISVLTGDGLVAQPQKVEKINISYAKTAKKVDVRRLKQSLWKLMTHTVPEENKENQDQNAEQSKEESTEDATLMKTSVLFSDLVKQLPNHVPSFMAKNISVPIAFVCMLHLANEKSLKLNRLDLNDIEISQPVTS